MNKAVLISIQPKWCELIASGKKTVEVRKTRPKLETPFKCYIYCTKDKNHSFCTDDGEQYTHIGNGKVIGEFVCDNIINIVYDVNEYYGVCQNQTQIPYDELHKYLNTCMGYGWHISDLVIYDKPSEFREFWKADKCPYARKDGCGYLYQCFRAGQTKRCGDKLTRPPQSWCYVEDDKR